MVVPVVRAHHVMLTRNLVYTAVTRAERALRARRRPGARCARRSRARDAGRRHTRLAERLAGGDDASRAVPSP